MDPPKLYRDEEWLRERVREGYSPAEIAEFCDVTEQTIERWIERNDVKPYRDEEWLQRQINHHVSERAIAEWCDVTEQTVKRWMRKFHIEHPGLAPASVMKSFLENRFDDLDEVSNKVQILTLWQRYQVRVQYGEIARAVGTTPQYVRQVIGEDPGGFLGQMMDSMDFLGSEPIPDHVAEEIKTRDEGNCVRCSSTEDIEIHHIIPGDSVPDNLATLCRDCHREAHREDFYTSNLAYDTRDEFWNTWIKQ